MRFVLIILVLETFIVTKACVSSRFNNGNPTIDKCVDQAFKLNETLTIAAPYLITSNNTELLTQLVEEILKKCIHNDPFFLELEKMEIILEKLPKPLPFTLFQPLNGFYILKAILETV